jgi:hypothetical protein
MPKRTAVFPFPSNPEETIIIKDMNMWTDYTRGGIYVTCRRHPYDISQTRSQLLQPQCGSSFPTPYTPISGIRSRSRKLKGRPRGEQCVSPSTLSYDLLVEIPPPFCCCADEFHSTISDLCCCVCPRLPHC